jgi:hypothetical protein
MNYRAMMQKQALPYETKKQYARQRAIEFFETITGRDENVHVSVGGLDSITLFLFLNKYCRLGVPGVSVSALEDKSIREIHRQLGIISIPPDMSKSKVIEAFGFPVISKAKASKIEHLQTPNSKKQTFIHAIMTGDMGEQGHFGHSDNIKLPDKWLKLFGGHYSQHRPDIDCAIAPFSVSAKCCTHMKERPADRWARQHNSHPYLGLMASEGGQREMGLVKNGCNYYGKTTTRSCPFAIFMRQDLLRLAIELDVPIPKIYGEIKKNVSGNLCTTRAQRTGCSMCGFGIHIEKRPHRFDRLREDNLKEWEYWMYSCCSDESGKYGWGRVLDWIGVEWEDAPFQQIEFSLEITE